LHICITVSTDSSNEIRKYKKITKLKAASHSDMQNIMSSIYTDGFTVNTTTQGICNSQNKNEKMTITFTNEHDKFYHIMFCTAHRMIINLLLKKSYSEFYDQMK